MRKNKVHDSNCHGPSYNFCANFSVTRSKFKWNRNQMQSSFFQNEAHLLSETRTGTEEQMQKLKLAEEELAQVCHKKYCQSYS